MLRVIVGAQWGDEGKGKIVDYLSRDVDAVARFQGGNNAGHTVVVGDQTIKLHLLPSGVVTEKICLMGNGMVVNPWALLDEVNELKKSGLNPDFLISSKAHLILPYHLDLDTKQETGRGSKRLGTTGKGIGPAYSDKANRSGLRASIFLLSRDELFEEVKGFLSATGKFGKELGNKLDDASSNLTNELMKIHHNFKEKIDDISAVLRDLLSKKKKILVEGAQGALLDLDHGTYPFCTSSNTVAPAACAGLGVSIWTVSEVIGVIKAYTTRVGTGPFPTELKNEVGDILVQKGKEFGTTTGRKRRCGWLDLVSLSYSNNLNGFTNLAITKLDTLSGLDPIKVCVAYSLNGKAIENMPINIRDLAKCIPIYKEFNGWKDPESLGWTSIVDKGYSALPEEAKQYLDFISGALNVPISLISVGPAREHTIDVPLDS
ncbi:MAG: adenylosuccinate synthase [Candidatus Hodarchaeales archaeon]|jgi:adenylosuccinate synthase